MSEPSGDKRLSFFETLHDPYYLSAPDYRQSFAGIRALHYLCHFLNECGYEAYVTSETTHPGLRAPTLGGRILRQHFLAGRRPIVLYPEIVSGNPLGGETVVRWLLNKPGHLGGDTRYAASDLIFYFDPWVLPEDLKGEHLRVPTQDWSIFNNLDNEFDDRRQGFCYYAHKFLHFGGTVPEEIKRHGISLGQERSLSHEEIAAHLRRAEALYCFEQSAMISEARACGCPVLIVPSEYNPTTQWEHLPAGVALSTEPDPLERLRHELRGIAREQEELFESSKQMIGAFIRITQQASRASAGTALPAQAPESARLWHLSPGERSRHLDEFEHIYRQTYPDVDADRTGAGNVRRAETFSESGYQHWLASRHETIARMPAALIEEERSASISFHLIMRQPDGATKALADTLENLGYQRHTRWHLDVITPLTAPAGIEDASSVGWHVTEKGTEKERIDALVDARDADWIVELPPGAVLDPLCLWRLAREILQHPDVQAAFVDDDLYDDTGARMKPRFKPGTNAELLKSSDLAGSVFVKKTVWEAIGGAAPGAASPWFGQLLRVAERSGWQAICHVPDVLISYPEQFPSDSEACMSEIAHHLLTLNLQPRLVRTSDTRWRIGYTPVRPQHVSICIVSQGRLELLNRTVSSLLENTGYPSFDILISIPGKLRDTELSGWLGECRTLTGGAIQHLVLAGENSFAAHCRQLAAAASGELMLLAEEGMEVKSDNWLQELAGLLDQTDVAAVSPTIIDAYPDRPGSTLRVPDLVGATGVAPPGTATSIATDDSAAESARDVSILPGQCLLVRKSACEALDSLSPACSSRDFVIADLCLRWRESGQRLVCTPLSIVAFHDWTLPDVIADKERAYRNEQTQSHEAAEFTRQWLKNGTHDSYGNPHLALSSHGAEIETRYTVQWQHLPDNLPKVLTRPLPNSQGDYRINYYLNALSRAGKVSAGIWQQPLTDARPPTPAEICRLGADSLVVQSYTQDNHLAVLHALRSLSSRPFVVHALDDLVTNLDPNSPFSRLHPADSRSRLKYALAHCDRLVVSTGYLAESFGSLIDDIRVVPNRLPGELWLPLRAGRRTGQRPRIGWAGGTTHHTDLMLLKEVILETRNEADWIFFGMCPPELRPLLTEYHGLTPPEEYPERLAALNLDLAVAPLADIPFNQARSNLRLLEYGALGIPVVCSDVEPYRNSPACRVRNTTAHWVQALRERIHDADAREAEGRALRRWVHENFLIENHMDEWLAAHLP